MKNQSSLNDIFRFVQLRGANILKAYPLKLTDTIRKAKNMTKEEKRKSADVFLSKLSFSDKKLKLGEVVLTVLSRYKEKDVPMSTVGKFVADVVEEINMNNKSKDWKENFDKDLDMLSELIYFSHYSTFDKLSESNLRLYVAYQVFEKASTNASFGKFLIYKIKLLDLGNINEPFIKSVGIADLLVVKQHLLRYEETEIAHIENVMKGETRSREHRFLDRFEETLIYENEKNVETEKESETTERFEMNRETAKTIQEDQKFSTDLSVSGKYGPPTIATNLAYSLDTSETTETNTSSEYAKDIMDRSLEKVNERVRTERITKIIKENETKDLHSFTNVHVESATAELKQISGIYQFVDKIYKAQVFNYGKREMFDLMIPEPASYLHFLNNNNLEISDNVLTPPKKFDINPFDLKYKFLRGYKASGEVFYVAGKDHYSIYVSLYQAVGIKPPPSDRTITMSLLHPIIEKIPEDRIVNSEAGIWLSPARIFDINIPPKYLPKKLDIDVLGLSDVGEAVRFTFQCANNEMRTKTIFYDNSKPESGLKMLYRYDKHEVMAGKASFEFKEDDYKTILSDENVLKLSYFAIESANHTITLKVECEPSEELIQEWQLETYDILQTAYQERLREYEGKLAQFNAKSKAQENFEKNNYGVPPSKQKQVMLSELKKHAISIFTDNLTYAPDDELTDTKAFNSNFPLVIDDEDKKLPIIDRIKAKKQGDFIRFFEQAFEWSQMQYALYPYFWSKQDDWENKFKQDDPNYEYRQFLQASAARLVLPVRLGFEDAVAYYLETGNVWGGVGAPSIQDPLYISIVDEIREQSGNSKKEPIPVGKPWEVRLPTSLIKLKAEDDLPKWKIKEGEDWVWEKDILNS